MEIERLVRDVKSGVTLPVALFSALATAQIYVPLTSSDSSDSAGTLWTFELAGKPHAALFTSAAGLHLFGRTAKHVVLAGRVLGETWPDGHTAAFNPTSEEISIMLSADEMKRLSSIEEFEPGQQVFVGTPAPPVPDYLPRILADAVSAVPHVQEGYLFQMHDAAHGSRLVGGFVLDPNADPRTTMPLVVDAVQNRMPPGEGLDLLLLDDGLLNSVLEYVEPVGRGFDTR